MREEGAQSVTSDIRRDLVNKIHAECELAKQIISDTSDVRKLRAYYSRIGHLNNPRKTRKCVS